MIESWLDWRTLPKRFLYNPTKPHRWYKTIRSADFQFDEEFRMWLREEMTTKGLSRDDLRDGVLFLQNHALRVSSRQDFLGLSAAFTLLVFAIFKMTGADTLAYIALGLFVVFALSERGMFADMKSATNELVNILRFELTVTGEKATRDSAWEEANKGH